ncbi:MAG: hypothetical protein Q8L48_01430 [Archangium sp.]|nr:hypothetical protein [Archangium sp.]
MLALALALLVMQAGPPAPPPKQGAKPKVDPGPTAYDTAKLFFLAGDLATAQEWVRRGLKREPKTCGPLNKLLAEYNFLANHIDEFTPDQAREFLELDRQISPAVRGKVTEKAWARFVAKPLELAQDQAKGGGGPRALQLLEQVLYVDPKNAEALALKAKLAKDAGP